jgi:hypothetical protein
LPVLAGGQASFFFARYLLRDQYPSHCLRSKWSGEIRLAQPANPRPTGTPAMSEPAHPDIE